MDLELLAKIQQENESVFGLTIFLEDAEQDFIFRPIGREEYRLVSEEYEHHQDLLEFQENLCQFSVLYPLDYVFSEGVAGVAEILADAILDISGLFENQALQLLVENREKMQNFDYQIECIIHEAFPEYTVEEISSWDMRKTMFFYARAEWILINLRGIQLEIMPTGEQQMAEGVQQATPEVMHGTKTDPNNDFEEVRIEDYETNPEVLVRMKASELNDHQKEIAESYTYNMLAGEAQSKGSFVGKIEKNIGNELMPELGFFASDFDLGK